jgi:hypothetical protein
MVGFTTSSLARQRWQIEPPKAFVTLLNIKSLRLAISA